MNALWCTPSLTCPILLSGSVGVTAVWGSEGLTRTNWGSLYTHDSRGPAGAKQRGGGGAVSQSGCSRSTYPGLLTCCCCCWAHLAQRTVCDPGWSCPAHNFGQCSGSCGWRMRCTVPCCTTTAAMEWVVAVAHSVALLLLCWTALCSQAGACNARAAHQTHVCALDPLPSL